MLIEKALHFPKTFWPFINVLFANFAKESLRLKKHFKDIRKYVRVGVRVHPNIQYPFKNSILLWDIIFNSSLHYLIVNRQRHRVFLRHVHDLVSENIVKCGKS